MIGRIIEIVETGRSLHLEYGSMVIRNEWGSVLDRIDLDEVLGVSCYPHGSTFSAALMAELSARGIPLVVSDGSFQPTGILLPVVGNFEQSRRIESQVMATVPLRKQVWARIVKHKLLMQALALELTGGNPNRLRLLASEVKSGDSSNLEGQGARVYWQEMFGRTFRRDRDQPGPNAMLNYGYAVLRATVARATVAAGLHPGIAVFHRNAYNGLRLVDDLMEPFRPLIDLRVFALVNSGHIEVNKITKRALVDVLSTDVPHVKGLTPVSVAAQSTATTFAQVLTRERQRVEYPDLREPSAYEGFLELAHWARL